MTEYVAQSIGREGTSSRSQEMPEIEYTHSWRMIAILATLLLINAFSQIDRILPFILAESIKYDLNLSDTEMGLLTGLAFAVCYSLLSLPLARESDRGSPRLVLVSCILLWSAMTAFGGFAASFLLLALTRLGVAIGEAGAVPAGHALIARKIRPERRGLAIGLFAMGVPLGTMIGFAAGGAIGDALGWRTAMVSAGAIGFVIGLLAFIVPGPTPMLSARPSTANRLWNPVAGFWRPRHFAGWSLPRSFSASLEHPSTPSPLPSSSAHTASAQARRAWLSVSCRA